MPPVFVVVLFCLFVCLIDFCLFVCVCFQPEISLIPIVKEKVELLVPSLYNLIVDRAFLFAVCCAVLLNVPVILRCIFLNLLQLLLKISYILILPFCSCLFKNILLKWKGKKVCGCGYLNIVSWKKKKKKNRKKNYFHCFLLCTVPSLFCIYRRIQTVSRWKIN